MQLIDAHNAEAYLRAAGRIAGDEEVTVRTLAGGVSNAVLLVATADGEPRFVLKQAREQLRVADPWFCSMERIWREVEVLDLCHRVLTLRVPGESHCGESEVRVPELLFCERDDYLFAMTAAPAHQVWKTILLAGNCSEEVAAASGRLLGRLHARTWRDSEVARKLADTSFFEELRIDPYYRHVARAQPDLAPAFDRLIQSLAEHPRCLVHGDFSPKNLLVYDRGVMLVDFEVGHFGDPAFDLGFFLSHLVLKAFYGGPRWWDYVRLTYSFWSAYEVLVRPKAGDDEYQSLVKRGIGNFLGCFLARVDGKSKVDYLAPSTSHIVRGCGRQLLMQPPRTWPELVAALLPYLHRV